MIITSLRNGTLQNVSLIGNWFTTATFDFWYQMKSLINFPLILNCKFHQVLY